MGYTPREGSYQDRVKKKLAANTRTAVVADDTVAWVKVETADIVLNYRDNSLKPSPDDADNVVSGLPGTDVIVTIRRTGGARGSVSLSLTNMTAPELQAVRDIFTIAFDKAAPITEERDKFAHDAADQGDDAYYRIYRRLPQFVDRRGDQS